MMGDPGIAQAAGAMEAEIDENYGNDNGRGGHAPGVQNLPLDGNVLAAFLRSILPWVAVDPAAQRAEPVAAGAAEGGADGGNEHDAAEQKDDGVDSA